MAGPPPRAVAPPVEPALARLPEPSSPSPPSPSPPSPPSLFAPAAPGFAPIAAPPGGTITHFAVAPTGDAALTVDDADEVRLWPALDGSREPLVVDLPTAHALGITRTPDGFEATLAVDGGGLVVQLGPDGHVISHVEHPTVTPAKVATKITTRGSDLVIPTAAGPRYLGYAFPASPSGLVPSRDADHLLFTSGERWLRLDDALASAGEVTPWTPPHTHVHALTWRAGDDWFASSEAGLLIDQLAANTGRIEFAHADVLAYEPSSQLLILDHRRLVRYAADRGTLEAIPFAGWGSALTTTTLVAPAVAGGPLLAQTERSTRGPDHLTMTWIHDLALPAHDARTLRVDGAYQVGAATTGRVAAAVAASQEVVTYFDGQALAPTTMSKYPAAPDGTHYLDSTRIGEVVTTRLLGPDGTALWTQPLDATALVWLDGAHLAYLPQTGGVAEVDLATGALVNLHAGWGFELGLEPHPVSTVGRPLARTLATGRDPELRLAGDQAFQALAREIATDSGTRVLGWGPVMLDGKATRTALLMRPGESGTPLFAYVYETTPGHARVITISGSGFSYFQDVTETRPEPPWGVAASPDGEDPHVRTIATTTMNIGTKWIHMSNEQLAISLSRGEPVVAADHWMERDNTGHGIDTTTGGATFGPSNRPRLARFKLHSMVTDTSAASDDAGTLAAGIVDLRLPD